MAIRLPLLLGFLVPFAVAGASGPPQPIHRFLAEHCLDCHDGVDADAGFDLRPLLGAEQGGLADPQRMAKWVRLFDRVHDGEMPPEDSGEVPADERKEFVRHTEDWLRTTQRAEQASLGRVRGRRLTNLQLERTLHDLLAIDLPLATLMPEEPRTEGFSNIADGQAMSHFQLESHLRVVDAALDEAFMRAAESDRDSNSLQAGSRDFSARQLCRQNPQRRCRDPEMLDGSAVVWSSKLLFYGRITSTKVEESGWYRVTFSASAVKKPDDHGVWCTVRSGHCNSGAPLMSWIGSFEATEQRSEKTFDAWIPAGHMLEIRPGDETLKRARFEGGQVGVGEGGPQNVPGLALHSMTMKRIHPGGDVRHVRRQLFGDMKVSIKRGKLLCRSEHPAADAVGQLREFARRAFRSSPDDKDLQRYVNMLRSQISGGGDPIEALKSSYRAILCSPRFLYFSELPGKLDDHAIASRLSYLIWSSMPDQELLDLADAGALHQPDAVAAQVERMLDGDRGRQFVEDFAAQWLDLIDINFTEPDRKLYRDFDIVVQNAMLDETHAYLEDLLTRDASIVEIIDSKHTFLNSRLARFYGIDSVPGETLRRVALKPKYHRGGLMSHGSLLKVTANGTNTSPVLRGIWVSERILGVDIPPPPASVPAIEPDIRGAKTIREQLQKHLADPMCASCHKNIDPPGFALENFDAAGRWRDHYVNVSGGRTRRGAPIDAHSTLADGRSFTNFQEFRQLLKKDLRPIAGNVAGKMLIYATGAPITFADRKVVAEIVTGAESSNYGFRSLLKSVVTSPTFLSK